MTREEVYDIIDGEREYQDSMNAEKNQPQIRDKRVLPIEGELLLLHRYLTIAHQTYAETFGDKFETPTMAIIRKIAAIAVRCMENHPTPLRKTETGE